MYGSEPLRAYSVYNKKKYSAIVFILIENISNYFIQEHAMFVFFSENPLPLWSYAKARFELSLLEIFEDVLISKSTTQLKGLSLSHFHGLLEKKRKTVQFQFILLQTNKVVTCLSTGLCKY